MRINLELSDLFFNDKQAREAPDQEALEVRASEVLSGWQEDYGDGHLAPADLVADYLERL